MMSSMWLNPAEFNFENAPLNKLWQPLCAATVYLLLINYLEWRALTKGVHSTILAIVQKVQIAHNLLLSLGSLVMVACMLHTSFHMWMGHYPEELDSGSEFLTCTLSKPPAVGRLWFWVYIFYLSKYWELLDTILQMTKGRRPPSYYFHVWHHTMYLLICYFYCAHKASLAPLAVIINGGVHVVMYFYYHLICRGISPWWKRHITKMQIIQFVLGYLFLMRTITLVLVEKQPCTGKGVLAVHAAFNLTMLVGFISILRRIQTQRKVSKGV
eukprot:Gregarina_sp_Pseudo_9__1303@NODE_1870_length_1284_cov_357_642570_g1736_i0_p1_GENE_NODE_1870_length_1284_cov_357_642570_g1736_i0NODE_1870_length_1284_cov_357_642570_g1736_i0_p1_ORF_typecomplete_len270_score17_49ELO/PF01151_18/7_8e41_NODE_1870_length_1284_cov_357_642570_g1736_i03411150